MTDFVLEQNHKISTISKSCLLSCINYANFLKQQLELWMFIPCKKVDGKWEILEEPKNLGRYLKRGAMEIYKEGYQHAKELCIFVELDVVDAGNGIFSVMKGNITFTATDVYTVEDLIKYDEPTLTLTAQKQIGL